MWEFRKPSLRIWVVHDLFSPDLKLTRNGTFSVTPFSAYFHPFSYLMYILETQSPSGSGTHVCACVTSQCIPRCCLKSKVGR